MSRVTINDLAGSIDQNYFVQGLLLASKDNSLGDMWEQCVTCPRCLFAKSCGILSEQLEARGQNPRCGQIVHILWGDIRPDHENIPKLAYYK